jgi:hypothetical protein
MYIQKKVRRENGKEKIREKIRVFFFKYFQIQRVSVDTAEILTLAPVQ